MAQICGENLCWLERNGATECEGGCYLARKLSGLPRADETRNEDEA